VLTVVKSTSTPNVTNTAAGTAATYSITVSNAANTAPATNVNISDALPAGFSYATTGSIVLNGGATRPATVNPTPGDTNPTFGTFTIPGGASVVIGFTVNIAGSVPSGTYSNPATATYLDPTRTTPNGTTSAGYPGGGAERVTVIFVPGLPNTSGLQVGADAAGPIGPHAPFNIALAVLGLIAVVGVLGIAVIAWRGDHHSFWHRLGRHPHVAPPVVLSLFVCGFAVSQFVPYPTTTPMSLSATAPIAGEAATRTELIGDTVVSHIKPAPPVQERFHDAAGPITPSRLRIPAIAVDAPIAGVGLLPDGSMGIPDNLWVSVWLSSSARPGQAGSAVIAGHRGIGTPALFGRLEKVRPGDRIRVSDAGGGELVYEVTRLASLDLSEATQIQVFGPTAEQQLVLITCSGEYSRSTRTYDHRLVVFSRLLPPNP
jgi:LPXTG-site transpeptidase (sortase) family protein